MALKNGMFTLVDDGRAKAAIYVGADAPEPVRLAASELQRYVREMSGATLEITAGPGAACALTIGRGGRKPTPNGAAPRRAAAAGKSACPLDHSDAYRIHATPSELAITGDNPSGVLFAVYDVLEQLGCGFCVPGDDTVPRRATLHLPAGDRSVAPAFTYRGQLDFPLRSMGQSLALIDWLAKNRINWYHPANNAVGLPVRGRPTAAAAELPAGSTRRPDNWIWRQEAVAAAVKQRGLHIQFGGHTMATWLPPDEYETDWFALIDGKRGGTVEKRNEALCVSSVPMRRQFVRNVRRFLDDNPGVEIVDLWHPDADSFCHCPRCAWAGTSPEAGEEFVGMAYLRTFVDFANEVARELRRTHPRVMLSPLVNYSMSTNWPLPHGVTIDDGVFVGLAHFPPLRESYRPLAGEPFSSGNHRLLAIDLSWRAEARHTYLYEYYNAWYMPFIHPQVRLAARDLRLLRSLGFNGISNDMLGWTPVNLYAVARLAWNPDLDPDALIREFCRLYYGPAAEAMSTYWISLEESILGVPGYFSGGPAREALGKQRDRWLDYLRDVRDGSRDEKIRSRVDRCLRPWEHFGDKDKARWWGAAAFDGEPQLHL